MFSLHKNDYSSKLIKFKKKNADQWEEEPKTKEVRHSKGKNEKYMNCSLIDGNQILVVKQLEAVFFSWDFEPLKILPAGEIDSITSDFTFFGLDEFGPNNAYLAACKVNAKLLTSDHYNHDWEG